MGLAVVCADCRAGPSELIEDGINGRLVPVDDVEALARAMSDLMIAPQLRNGLVARPAKSENNTRRMPLWINGNLFCRRFASNQIRLAMKVEWLTDRWTSVFERVFG